MTVRRIGCRSVRLKKIQTKTGSSRFLFIEKVTGHLLVISYGQLKADPSQPNALKVKNLKIK